MAFDLKRVTKLQAKATGNLSSIAKSIPGVSNLIGETPLGEFLGLSTKDVWRLKVLDENSTLPDKEFKGQFIAENLTENIGARLSTDSSLNKQGTDSKYLGGDEETITFTTRMWASTSIKNIKKSVELLKQFTKRDPNLKRAPLFNFTAGTEIQAKCFVRSVGNVVYDRPRSDGTIRGVVFSVTLTKVEDIQTSEQGLSVAALVKSGLGIVSAAQNYTSFFNKIEIPGGSLHTKGRKIITKQNQTFEHIAQTEYGSAQTGDVLRRAYYNRPLSQIKTALEVGDVIDIVDEDEIFDIKITAQSVALKDNTLNRENIQNHLDLRGGTKTVFY